MGDNIDLKEIILRYLKHWKWFVLTTMMAVGLALVYLRYATPQYQASAKIQILEEDGGAGGNLFDGGDLLGLGKNNVLDEIELLNSRSNFIEVVKNLKLNINISEVGEIKTSSIYQNPPVVLNFIAEDSIINKSDYTFFINIKSETAYSFSEEKDGNFVNKNFGKALPSPIGDIVLTPNYGFFKKNIGKKIKIAIVPIVVMGEIYRNSVSISNDDEKSNIVRLSLKDANAMKAINILDELIRIFNKNAIQDKKVIADRTRDFINDRIADISTNLTSVDASAEDLRTSRGITDIASETNVNLNLGANNQQQLVSARNEYNIASSMKDIIDQEEGYNTLPSNIGISDPTIASTTAKYNELVQERQRLLKTANAKNPVVLNVEQQLQGLKASMKSSLNSTVNNLGLTVNTLSGQQAIINSRIYSAPSKERALRDITRKQQTTEELYLYLLQKREEAQIAVASTSPKCKIIDWGYKSQRGPVSPRKSLVLLAAIFMGLLIPFGFIYIYDLLDNKVRNMKNLSVLARNIPILGEIPSISKKQMKTIANDDRSVLSEALRIFRTNLDYLIKTNREGSKKNNIIFISSSVSGEGKTFVSSNLAMILASTDKKVLLLGADIRNPKIHNFFTGKDFRNEKIEDLNNKIGFTEYLHNSTIDLDSIIHKVKVYEKKIDVIYSGKIPPNPAELLLSGKVKSLLKNVSEAYDYVIVDTAPLMVVTDTLLISQYADHLIYVTRAGVTDNKAVEFPIKLQEEGKLKGLTFVVNDVKNAHLGYGGMYGYGYGKKAKKWWHFK